MELKLFAELPHQAIQKLAKRYGEVTGFYLGRRPIIVISGMDAIREALMRQDLGGRPSPNEYQKLLTGGFVCGM